ncbi:M48 family metallopeptidase [Halopiger goleimassiliensis]|uniref:M48 family metallopeptidase n=1 Tax=Halopiger goleimassiliensis TaxID=1293048 RepID=UPI000677D352|nr:M48 family metalloprotease [Halopiger goleimassiliensis]
MRLTSPVGLLVRALLGACVSGLALLGSAYTVVAFAAAVVLVVVTEVGPVALTESNVLWALGLGSVLVLPCFAFVVAHAIRLERRRLLETTVPVAATDSETARTLEATATRLAAQFDVSKPAIRLHPAETPVAYTTYRPTDPVVAIRRTGSPVVVVSKGLVRTLSNEEREAVLAHEFGHLANDDLQLTSWLLVPLFAADFLDDNDDEWRVDPLGWVLTSVGLVGVGVFSRGRELAADRAAVEATGNPGALASALETLHDRRTRRPTTDLRASARTTNAINVLPTLGDSGPGTGGLRGTHPPLEARLEQCRSLAVDAPEE